MGESAVYLQPAFILRHRPYRESSVLLEVFTRDFGIVSMLAKGVRQKKSKIAGVLQPFSLLMLSYLDKHELKVLIQAEYVYSHPLRRLGLYCGFYVNELLQMLLHKHDPHPDLFFRYQACLHALLDDGCIEQSLRYFELDLLDQAGYGVQLDVAQSGDGRIDIRRRYKFVSGLGMVEDNEGYIGGETLLALAARKPLQGVALVEAKQLLRSMLNVHLRGRSLKSRDVLAKIIRYL